MGLYKMHVLSKDTLLIVAIDLGFSVAGLIETFRESNSDFSGKVIIDLLILTGDRENRFIYADVKKGHFTMNDLRSYSAKENEVNKSYEVFASVPVGFIEQIAQPRIRTIVMNKHLELLKH